MSLHPNRDYTSLVRKSQVSKSNIASRNRRKSVAKTRRSSNFHVHTPRNIKRIYPPKPKPPQLSMLKWVLFTEALKSHLESGFPGSIRNSSRLVGN